MDESLKEILRHVPEDVFWRGNEQGEHVPNYNGIFGWVLRHEFGDDSVDATVLITDIERGLKVPNISTFQRSVADERRRRDNGA